MLWRGFSEHLQGSILWAAQLQWQTGCVIYDGWSNLVTHLLLLVENNQTRRLCQDHLIAQIKPCQVRAILSVLHWLRFRSIGLFDKLGVTWWKNKAKVVEYKQACAETSPGWFSLYLQADGRFLRGSRRLRSASQKVPPGASWVAVLEGFCGAATEL